MTAATASSAEDARREITYFEAIFEAQREEMGRDERVILIGEDIALYGATGFLAGFGPDRLYSAPISENSFTGMAIGAALTGLRPIVDLTIASFVYLAMDQLVHQAGKLRYMTGGQARVPAVFRASMWHNGSNAGHHSDRPYPMFMNCPGLHIALPATPYDMKGLLKAAIRSDDPVLLFEDNDLWFQRGPVPEDDYVVPLGRASVRREGQDLTIVAIGASVGPALAAAHVLSEQGVSSEVIDPRSLAPLDEQTILTSVGKTGRLVLVEPAARTAGATAEIAALVAEQAFDALKAPVVRVAAPDVPIPFSPVMEKPLYPNEEAILTAARGLF